MNNCILSAINIIMQISTIIIIINLIPEAFSGLSTVLRLSQTTLIPAVIAGVGSLELNLLLSQRISFPLGASEAGDVKRGLLQEVSFCEQI